MTKNIRVENADTSDAQVVVQVFDRQADGPDVCVREHFLTSPAAMTPPDLYITGTRYLVVKEVAQEDRR